MLSSSIRNARRGICERHAFCKRNVKTLAKQRRSPTNTPPQASPTDVQLLSSATNDLIKGTKHARKDPKWKHTNDKKNEQTRLAEDVLRRSASRHDHATLAEGDDVNEVGSAEDSLNISSTEALMQPGTFFELRRLVLCN